MRPIRILFGVSLVALLITSCVSAQRPDAEEPATTRVPVIEIPNWKAPLDGVLTGGQPTAEQIEEAARLGYVAIVNTRATDEPGFEWERAFVEELGMRYLQIPVSSVGDLTRENVEELARILDDRDGAPVMLHCKSGNRVGALLALKAAWLDGASVDEAMQLGLDAGLTRLENPTRGLLEQN